MFSPQPKANLESEKECEREIKMRLLSQRTDYDKFGLSSSLKGGERHNFRSLLFRKNSLAERRCRSQRKIRFKCFVLLLKNTGSVGLSNEIVNISPPNRLFLEKDARNAQ